MSGSGERSAPAQVLITAVAVVVALAVAALVDVGGATLEARSMQRNVDSARQAEQDDNFAGLVASISALQSGLRDLDGYFSGPGWLLARVAPPVNSSFDLLRATNQLSADSAGFVTIAETLASYQPGPGKPLVPPAVLDRLGPAAQQLERGLSDFDAAVHNARQHLPPVIGPKLDEVLAQAANLTPKISGLLHAMPALTDLLGRQGPQQWFVVWQNLTESRGTGGLVGAYSVLKIDQGTPEVVATGPNDDLTALATAELLPADTRALWGTERLKRIYGVNLSPNYPYAGELLASIWTKQTRQVPDAVLALDQATAVSFVQATGPVTVDGITITPENAEHFLTVDVYERFPNPAEKDAFVSKLISHLLKQISDGKAPLLPLLRVLFDHAMAGQVFVWTPDAAKQQLISGSPVSGEVPDRPGPFAMAVVNSNSGNKMDAYLHTAVNYTSGECVPGGRRGTVSVTLRNSPPSHIPAYVQTQDARISILGKKPRPGWNTVRLSVYLPHGAVVTARPQDLQVVGEERGHPVYTIAVDLRPNESKTVELPFTQFGPAEALNADPVLQHQPMLNPQELTLVAGPKC